MWILIVIGVIAAAIVAFGTWTNRRWDEVDSYHEREYRDPPIADYGSYLGGDR